MRMRGLLLVLLGSTSACAASVQSAEIVEPGTPPTRSAAITSPVVEPAPEAAPVVEAPRARPRLTRTVTLGQGQDDLTYTGPKPVAPPGQGGPQVVVNNNVIVQNTAPAYGYGFGYGGYGRGGYGRGYDGFTPRGSGQSGSGQSGWGQWGSTGFEGARRTAGPGQTPGVGGNWAPAPSYGPASMR